MILLRKFERIFLGFARTELFVLVGEFSMPDQECKSPLRTTIVMPLSLDPLRIRLSVLAKVLGAIGKEYG